MSVLPAMTEEKQERDLLGEWLAMGKELLKQHYPDAKYLALTGDLGPGVPPVQLVVTPDAFSSACLPTSAQSEPLPLLRSGGVSAPPL